MLLSLHKSPTPAIFKINYNSEGIKWWIYKRAQWNSKNGQDKSLFVKIACLYIVHIQLDSIQYKENSYA